MDNVIQLHKAVQELATIHFIITDDKLCLVSNLVDQPPKGVVAFVNSFFNNSSSMRYNHYLELGDVPGIRLIIDEPVSAGSR